MRGCVSLPPVPSSDDAKKDREHVREELAILGRSPFGLARLLRHGAVRGTLGPRDKYYLKVSKHEFY